MDLPGSVAQTQIIVVDDDQLVRDFAVHTIEYGINRQVATFDTGFNAWQFLLNRPDEADIIIADANIPDMDGVELLCIEAGFKRGDLAIYAIFDGMNCKITYQLIVVHNDDLCLCD